jgi:SAM-dependent methyltransferase
LTDPVDGPAGDGQGDPIPPVGDPLRYTVIAHRGRRSLGPVASARLDALVARTALGRGDHALELGTGKGELLVRLLERWPEATAEGFDRSPWFLATARRRAESAGVAGRVSFVLTDAPGALIADRAVALTMALGATGILGGQAETVAGLARATRPGGTVVFGDGVWLAEPPADGLAAFGMDRAELVDGAEGLAALGVAAGLEVLDVELVTPEEWDAYEAAYSDGVGAWLAANPDDPDHAAFAARRVKMDASYRDWRRGTFGFGIARYRVRG